MNNNSFRTATADDVPVNRSDMIRCQDHFRKLEVNEKDVLPWFVYMVRNKDKLLKVSPHELNVYSQQQQQQQQEEESQPSAYQNGHVLSSTADHAMPGNQDAMDT